MPTVEVYIVPSDADRTGVGQPGTPPIAPAVANAVFVATGQRLRRLPFGDQLSGRWTGAALSLTSICEIRKIAEEIRCWQGGALPAAIRAISPSAPRRLQDAGGS